MVTIEELVSKSIEDTIRKQLPVKNILREYKHAFVFFIFRRIKNIFFSISRDLKNTGVFVKNMPQIL